MNVRREDFEHLVEECAATALGAAILGWNRLQAQRRDGQRRRREGEGEGAKAHASCELPDASRVLAQLRGVLNAVTDLLRPTTPR